MRNAKVANWTQVRYPWLYILAVGGTIGLLTAVQPAFMLYPALGLAALGVLVLMAVVLLRAPEIFFALYMNVGYFKAGLLPLQERLGFDFTVALAIPVIVGVAIKILRQKNRILLHWPVLLAYLLLGGWLCFSMIWSPAQARGWDKSVRFTTLTLLAFAAPMFLLDTWLRLERFFWTFFLAGMVFTVRAMMSLYLAGGLQRLVNVLGADYLILGHVCGMTAGLGAYFLVGYKTKWWLRLLLLVGVIASFLVMSLGAARGPLVAWLLAFTSPTFLGRRRSRQSLLVLGILLIGVVLFVGSWAFGWLPYEVTARFELLFAAFFRGDLLALELVPRLHIWRVGLDMFLQHPILGAGAGAYQTSVRGLEIVYPHNVFLEAGAELGIVGLILVLFLIVMPLVRWRRCSEMRLSSRHKSIFDLVLWVYSFFFVEVIKSGDFNSNRTFWMSVGIMMSVCAITRRENGQRACVSRF